MRRYKKQLQIFSLSFLDVICCGLGAVLIVLLLYSVRLRAREANVSKLEKHNSKLIAENEVLSAISNKLASAETKISELKQNTIPKNEVKTLKDKLLEFEKNSITPVEAQKIKKELQLAKQTKTILGVSISKRKLVFLIDASGSMRDEKGDARLSDAKGAFKAMIASLDSSYKIDLVWYSEDSISEKIKGKWNRLETVTDYNKREGMDFITNIDPLGGTPTMGAFKYVFRKYPDAEAIVLLSDGAPTDFATKTVSNWEKSADGIKRYNIKPIPIYCIGVGKEMAKSYSDARRFLEKVAKDSEGDCVTF